MKKHISLFLSLLLALGLLTGCADAAMEILDFVDDALEEETDLPSEEAPSSQEDEEPEAILPEEEEPEKQIQEEPAEEIPEVIPPAKEKEEVNSDPDPPTEEPEEGFPDENGTYTSPEEVAAYLARYNRLPSNFITKKEAEALGWDSSSGNLQKVAPGKSIGGDRFGNYEKRLPTAKGRTYTECDVNYKGGYRGRERLVFSNDGLIYYTNDHYTTFTLLYKDGVKQ